jgi:hypothetical protein
MAKRLTDTAKWRNPWFRKVPTKYKMLFLYMLDECDNAGVIHLDLDLISFLLGESFSREEFNQHLGSKISYIGEEKIIINSFIKFQNGDVSNSTHPMSKHILKELERHGILNRFKNGDFGRDIPLNS